MIAVAFGVVVLIIWVAAVGAAIGEANAKAAEVQRKKIAEEERAKLLSLLSAAVVFRGTVWRVVHYRQGFVRLEDGRQQVEVPAHEVIQVRGQ